MIARREPCTHIRLLSKDAVQKTVATELSPQCYLHSNIPSYYLCLHCATPLCLQFEGQLSCLQYHNKTNPTHVFCLQIEQGSIWCHCCQETIQNQLFDYGPNDKEEGVVKLRRFQKFISDAWKELLNKNNVNFVGSYHSGIQNLGNTCFLSVVLQSLFASLPLYQLYERMEVKQDRMFLQEKSVGKEIEYFYDDIISKHEAQQWNIVSDKRDRSRQQAKKPFTNSIKNAKFNIIIKQFFKTMEKRQTSPFIPSKILDNLCKLNDKYREKHQQDAEQLFLLILDALNEGQRLNFLRDLDRYKQIQTILGFQKLTPIQKIFSFYFLNEIQCSGCRQVNRSLNLAYSIPLAIGGDREAVDRGHAKGKVPIDYWQELFYPQSTKCCPLFTSFFQIQRLCKAKNYYECAKCRSLLAFSKYYIVNQPKILILSFKQFNAKLQKKAEKIEFPLQLTLEGVSLDQNHPKYSLYAVIVHEGMTITTGHYVCFIFLDGQWLLCSDEKVQVVSPKFVLQQQPYVLLYQHV